MTSTVWTPERLAMARQLRAEGLTARAAAQRFNETLFKHAPHITRSAVIGIWGRLGLSKPLPPGEAERRAERAKNAKHGKVSKQKARQAKEQARVAIRPTPPLRYAPARNIGPQKGETAVRFFERVEGRCAMFCVGESGDEGYVCGAATTRGAWCAACRAIVYVPAIGQARAR